MQRAVDAAQMTSYPKPVNKLEMLTRVKNHAQTQTPDRQASSARWRIWLKSRNRHK